jgi:short-subunit dehydrogenase
MWVDRRTGRRKTKANSIQLGPPTILINNAGIVHTKSILDSSAEEVEQYAAYHTPQ